MSIVDRIFRKKEKPPVPAETVRWDDLAAWVDARRESALLDIGQPCGELADRATALVRSLKDAVSDFSRAKIAVDESVENIAREMKANFVKRTVTLLHAVPYPQDSGYATIEKFHGELAAALVGLNEAVHSNRYILLFFESELAGFKALVRELAATADEIGAKLASKSGTIASYGKLREAMNNQQRLVSERDALRARLNGVVEPAGVFHPVDDAGLSELREESSYAKAQCTVIENEILSLLLPLERPFRKLEALAEKDELKTIEAYLSRPLETLLAEDVGYPKLRFMLFRMRQFIKDGKITLKESVAEKTLQKISEIEAGALSALVDGHRAASKMLDEKKRLLEPLEAQQREASALQERRRAADAEAAALRGKIAAIEKAVSSQSAALADTVEKTTGVRIEIIYG